MQAILWAGSTISGGSWVIQHRESLLLSLLFGIIFYYIPCLFLSNECQSGSWSHRFYCSHTHRPGRQSICTIPLQAFEQHNTGSIYWKWFRSSESALSRHLAPFPLVEDKRFVCNQGHLKWWRLFQLFPLPFLGCVFSYCRGKPYSWSSTA